MTAPSITTTAQPVPLPDPVADTVVHEDLAEALNRLLAATETQEHRLPLKLNRRGQWCTYGVGGWRAHASYQAAYQAAHAEEVA